MPAFPFGDPLASDPQFAHLRESVRSAVTEILKREFPSYAKTGKIGPPAVAGFFEALVTFSIHKSGSKSKAQFMLCMNRNTIRKYCKRFNITTPESTHDETLGR